jgi:CRISPR-associated exonuclease Cas4
VPTFTDLGQATYCPRQLYYARRNDDREPPPEVAEIQELAFRYDELRTADDTTLRAVPIAVAPDDYRRALDVLAERDDWNRLCDPVERDRLLDGRDARGIAHKILPEKSCTDESTPIPTLVSPGQPPERGV